MSIDLPAPLLVSDREAAHLAGVSRATWWRLHAAAKTPATVKLGRCRRWNRAEIVAWIEAGCPPRQLWEAAYAQRKRAAQGSGRR